MATMKQLSICERHAKFVIESRQHIDKLDLNDNKNDEKNEWYSDGWNWYIHKYVINTTLKIRIKRTNYNNIKKSINPTFLANIFCFYRFFNIIVICSLNTYF